MLSFSNAKINLGLNVTSKRADGYHNIESVFYPISWSDILEVVPSDTFSFTSSGLEIPGKFENNLVIKAYKLLEEENLIPSEKSVSIYLHKILPMGAGIGGGSSNAAFALKLINSTLNLNLTSNQLENYAEKIGSDCPFFIQNKPKFCYGKGTEFKDIDISLKGKYITLINPEIHISTQEAYSGIIPSKPEKSIQEIINMPIDSWKDVLINDFEASVSRKHTIITEIKDMLYEKGALYASMTGSGSTIYGIWNENPNLNALFRNYIYWSGILE